MNIPLFKSDTKEAKDSAKCYGNTNTSYKIERQNAQILENCHFDVTVALN